jgi:signal transduction histidine kinase
VELLGELSDLVEDLQHKSEKGEPLNKADFEELSDLASDLTVNLEKVQKHGSRADKIVRSMLQHAREGSAEKVPTDVNALIAEYAHLSYHGMRAGAKAITCDMNYELDPATGPLPVVPQDFSRIFVNIINNAFDALWDKLQTLPEPEKQTFRPKVTVRSRSTETSVVFDIEDNGPGIPEAIRDKILQPFFTTKQGTEGTGLGLSITNDIILAHNGTLAIGTGENGTTFTITIPRS